MLILKNTFLMFLLFEIECYLILKQEKKERMSYVAKSTIKQAITFLY